MLPEYQRAVVAAIPDVAQRATLEVARRHGNPEGERGPMLAVLWKGSGIPVVGGGGIFDRALPVVDPVLDMGLGGNYLETAREKREQRARRYLDELNMQALAVFGGVPSVGSSFRGPAQMCQFNNLWDGYTCGHLMKLLDEEYPMSNLPHLIRTTEREVLDQPGLEGALLDRDFTFIAVVYAKQVPEMLPGLFVNPIEGDALCFAQVRMFVPWRRLQFWLSSEGGSGRRSPFEDGNGTGGTPVRWTVGRQEWRTLTDTGSPPPPDRQNAWDLFNQSWTVQLVPATHDNLAAILQTPPPLPELVDFKLPNLGLSSQEIRQTSMH
jgi:hypothetical protein